VKWGGPKPSLIPEFRAVVEELVTAPHIIDENIQAILFVVDLQKYILYFIVVQMIATNSDAFAAKFGYFFRGLIYGSWQVYRCLTFFYRSASDVNGSSGFAQSQSDAFPNAATCPCHESNSTGKWLHKKFPYLWHEVRRWICGSIDAGKRANVIEMSSAGIALQSS
jgi:hypothetical protein